MASVKLWRKNHKFLAVLLMVVLVGSLCAFGGYEWGYHFAKAQSSSSLNPLTLNAGPIPGAPTYTIFTDNNGNFYAKDAQGSIDFTSTNFDTVFNSIISSGTSGTILIGSGTFYSTSTLIINGETWSIFGEGTNQATGTVINIVGQAVWGFNVENEITPITISNLAIVGNSVSLGGILISSGNKYTVCNNLLLTYNMPIGYEIVNASYYNTLENAAIYCYDSIVIGNSVASSNNNFFTGDLGSGSDASGSIGLWVSYGLTNSFQSCTFAQNTFNVYIDTNALWNTFYSLRSEQAVESGVVLVGAYNKFYGDIFDTDVLGINFTVNTAGNVFSGPEFSGCSTNVLDSAWADGISGTGGFNAPTQKNVIEDSNSYVTQITKMVYMTVSGPANSTNFVTGLSAGAVYVTASFLTNDTATYGIPSWSWMPTGTTNVTITLSSPGGGWYVRVTAQTALAP